MAATKSGGTSATGRTRRSSAETREHVLGTAHELFYWHGIRATGVDRIAAEAQVAPTTLYRLFASKDDLVVAYLERNDAGYRDWLRSATAPNVGSARERIVALFDALTEQVQPERCRGCPFLMALAEYPDPASPVHARAVVTKAWVRERLRELTAELPGASARGQFVLADQLALVMEGVYASIQALGVSGPASHARATVETLVDVACR